MEIVYQEEEKKEMKLEEALDRIDMLLKKMGDKEVSLEETFSLYQEGMQIDEEGQIHEFS